MRQAVVTTVTGNHQVPPRRYPNMTFLISSLAGRKYSHAQKIVLADDVTLYILQWAASGPVQVIALHDATDQDIEELSAVLEFKLQEAPHP